jgi:hypothetical protein
MDSEERMVVAQQHFLARLRIVAPRYLPLTCSRSSSRCSGSAP